MSKPPSVPCLRWLAERPPNDVEQSLSRLAALPDVVRMAVMPDVHLASEVCVGVVLATRSTIYPAAVGSDLGCGMAAVRFHATSDLLADPARAAQLLAGLYECVPSIRHSRATCRAKMPDELFERPLSHPSFEKQKHRDALVQFGTLGRGNHFVEFQADEQDQLWLLVHSGSRGIGQQMANHHTDRANEHAAIAGEKSSRPAGIPIDSPAGQAYLVDLNWAIAYAAASRRAIVDAVADLLARRFAVELDRESYFDGNHNHVRHETHLGDACWVHRKGAASARLGEPGVIPGSMGAASFHIEGRGLAESLHSCSHGAGRALSRGQAARQIRVADLIRQMRGVWFDQRRAHLLRDEAPEAYKEIHAVMRAQRDLVKITRQLQPFLSYKGA